MQFSTMQSTTRTGFIPLLHSPPEQDHLKYSAYNMAISIPKTLHISRAITPLKSKPVIGKTKNKNSDRIIPITTIANEYITELKKSHSPTDFLFKTPNGNLYTIQSYSKRRYKQFFNELLKQNIIEEILTPHELRHTVGTILYQTTHDIFAVSRFLGHSSVETTAKIYVHENVQMLREHLNII